MNDHKQYHSHLQNSVNLRVFCDCLLQVQVNWRLPASGHIDHVIYADPSRGGCVTESVFILATPAAHVWNMDVWVTGKRGQGTFILWLCGIVLPQRRETLVLHCSASCSIMHCPTIVHCSLNPIWQCDESVSALINHHLFESACCSLLYKRVFLYQRLFLEQKDCRLVFVWKMYLTYFHTHNIPLSVSHTCPVCLNSFIKLLSKTNFIQP